MKPIPARYRSAAIWAATVAFYALLFVPMLLPDSPTENTSLAPQPIQRHLKDASTVTVPRPGDRDMTGAVILRPELPPVTDGPSVRTPSAAPSSSSGD